MQSSSTFYRNEKFHLNFKHEKSQRTTLKNMLNELNENTNKFLYKENYYYLFAFISFDIKFCYNKELMLSNIIIVIIIMYF